MRAVIACHVHYTWGLRLRLSHRRCMDIEMCFVFVLYLYINSGRPSNMCAVSFYSSPRSLVYNCAHFIGQPSLCRTHIVIMMLFFSFAPRCEREREALGVGIFFPHRSYISSLLCCFFLACSILCNAMLIGSRARVFYL